MMKTDVKKVFIQVDTAETDPVEQENVKNTRKGLKMLQPKAGNEENLVGRTIKDIKKIGNPVKKAKPLLMHKETQTEKYITSLDDLTGEEASADYWKRLAEKRQESLDESLQEIEKLKCDIEVLQEENKICKEMLEESKTLVEVLQEMIKEGEEDEKEEVEEEPTPKAEHDSDSSV
ncbi:serrate RNA effector molecule homolog [Anthonomus grandis grandis]|uniref:serrate RNA effector molecule homolog n=1 Tax=Anthonomus grandis grandis TaxID=2921223 RepID=UPI002165C385|nr:serrate RNA effector molecule homolog [Anthonomus grandis grandis]